MSTKKRPLRFIFPITLSKTNRFQWFLVWEFLRKFDINSLYICPPYRYTVTTLPWEIKKVIFQQYYSYRLQIITLSQKKQTATVVLQLSVYLLLFTASYYLLSPILWSVFLSLWSVIFKATNAKPQLALFRVTNIWRNAALPAVRCKSFTFYKAVWWHFSDVVGKGGPFLWTQCITRWLSMVNHWLVCLCQKGSELCMHELKNSQSAFLTTSGLTITFTFNLWP